MRIVSRKKFVESSEKFSAYKDRIFALYDVLKKGEWGTPEAMKNELASLDNFKYQPGWYVLDIGGKKGLRVISGINFKTKTMFIKFIGNHTEYDRITDEHRGKKR